MFRQRKKSNTSEIRCLMRFYTNALQSFVDQILIICGHHYALSKLVENHTAFLGVPSMVQENNVTCYWVLPRAVPDDDQVI